MGRAVTRDEMKTRQEFCETLAYQLGGLGERRKLPTNPYSRPMGLSKQHALSVAVPGGSPPIAPLPQMNDGPYITMLNAYDVAN